ncbi:methyltransferase domain-containing protein [Aquimarina sp. 2201CG5-10]|uniref:methyltransferase domain-containing protein n=1 Tax=Aquimarina callyspongiae TaxID=3098150 RepID=UPI002AB370C9|nr:methyltransferase domain-containing protein [Aquimarina sp. 2201CG5-10]MDY8136107.1 methyltransferase domain-containing protein [Aquimarina sp. 2201CG5-10]
MLIDTTYRSEEEELMDDFEMQGETLEKTLKDIAKLNKWLGGNRITIKGVTFLLKKLSKDKTYHITDIGCGNGDMLRAIAKLGRKLGYQFKLLGIDANKFTIENAKELSIHYPEISYQVDDIFNDSYARQNFDIVLCTLTLHHFNNQQIEDLLYTLNKQTSVGVVINDLQRSKLAYYLFKLVCAIFINNPMAKYDGAISILRGFRKNELKKFAEKLKPSKHYIQWKWAFRYQWIIKK